MNPPNPAKPTPGRHARPNPRASERLAAHLAGDRTKRSLLARTGIVLGLAAAAGVVTLTLTTSASTKSTEVAPATLSAAHPKAPASSLVPEPTRTPSLSRSVGNQRGDTSTTLVESRLERAVQEAEERAAAKKERLARIAAREAAEAKAARIAARKEAERQARLERKAATKEAARQAAQEAAEEAAASTDPGTLRDMARREMLAFGFAADQWTYLDQLVMRESGWNPLAQNPSSGAYGLPQSLPGDKMATEGADWRTNPVTQIRWMLSYIAERYGNPAAAWGHSETHGWY